MPLRRRSRSASGAPEFLEVRTLLAAGDLDPSFGRDGVVDVEFDQRESVPTTNVAIERQSDGKLVVLSRGTVTDFINLSNNVHTPYLARFLPDGSRDLSFGDAGRIVLPNGIPRQMAVQSDDGFVVAVEVGSDVRLHRFRGDGTIDTTFAGTGSRTLTGGAGVIVGLESLASGGVLLQQGGSLFQLNADGSNDTNFDGDGRSDVGAAGEQGGGFVIQPDGRVVVVTWLSAPFRILARRINTEGANDPTFASGKFERSVTDFPAQEAQKPVRAPDGSLYLPVSVFGGFLTLKLNAAGEIDTGFDGDGIQVTGLGGFNEGVSAVMQSDHKLVLASEIDGEGTSRGWIVARYLPDGRLDASFGGTGIVELDFALGRAVDRLSDIILQPDGKMIGVGMSDDNGLSYGAIARLTSAGQLDKSFSGDGRVVHSHKTDRPFSPREVASATDSTGRVLVIGSSLARSTRVERAFVRFHPDGARDVAFQGADLYDAFLESGFVQSSSSNAVSPQPDGGVLIAGTGIFKDSLLVKQVGALARLKPDGTLDPAFGDQGIARIPALATADFVVPLPDGSSLVTGESQGTFDINSMKTRVVRLGSNGTLDPSFGNGGLAETVEAGPSFFLERIVDLTTTADGKIIAITRSSAANNGFQTRVHLKRWFANGALDRSLGGTGQREIPVDSPNSESPIRIFSVPNDRVAVLTAGSGFTQLHYLDDTGNTVSTVTLHQGNDLRNVDGTLLANGGLSVLATSVILRTTPDRVVDPDWSRPLELGAIPTNAASQAAMPDTRLVFARVVGGGDTPLRIELRRFLAGPGVLTTPRDTLTTTETGTTATFDVRLSSKPTANVTIPVASSDATEGTVSVNSLTFTPDNWSTAQSVTITGVDDTLFDADQRYRIVLGPATSTDADYNGKAVRPVEVRSRDDETLRFFRAYNPQANFHFFTTSVSEFQGVQPNGYNDESSGRGGFSLVATAQSGFTPLFRLYNLQKGYHYYTASVAEKDFLLSLNPPSTDPNFGKVGWRFEGSPGFIADTQQSGTSQVFRLYNKTSGAHLFTENPAVRAAVLQSPEWEEHAPLGFAFLVDDAEPATTLAGPPSAMGAVPSVSTSSERTINVASLMATPSAARSLPVAQPQASDQDESTVLVDDENLSDVVALDACLGAFDWGLVDATV
jgi:uncharacterized delta-60 repeat protein